MANGNDTNMLNFCWQTLKIVPQIDRIPKTIKMLVENMPEACSLFLTHAAYFNG